jgi:mRNA interferase MazF
MAKPDNKDFNLWHQLKEVLHRSNKIMYTYEREIWWCSIGANIGYEQDGKGQSFERPVLIVKVFNEHLVWVIPLTSSIKDNKYYFKYTQTETNDSGDEITKECSALVSQLRVISTKRLLRKLGMFPINEYSQLKNRILETLK